MNQQLKKNPLLRVLSSLNLTLVILAVFGVAIAVATFVEVRYGTAGARGMVYNARWFELLLGLLVVNLVVSLIANMPYRRHQLGFVITHIAFILVVVSSGITRFLGYEGSMHIREGESADFILSDKDHVQVSIDGQISSFPVRLYKEGQRARGEVSLAGEKFNVSIDEFWPHVEMRTVEGSGGRPVVAFTHGGGRGLLELGSTEKLPGVTVHFLGQDREVEASSSSGSTYGDLMIRLGGNTHRLPVPKTPPADIEAGGFRFRIVEFAPNFRVGAESLPTDPMNNPAIRVEIEGPGGEKDRRLLFAFHPDFDMGHSGSPDDKVFENVDMTYQYGRNVYLFSDGAEGLAGRADFAMEIGQGEQHSGGTPVAAGERFALAAETMLHADMFSFIVNDFWQSAIEKPSPSDNKDNPPAVNVTVKDEAGNSTQALVTRWSEGSPISLGGRDLFVAFGPVRIAVPYRVHLDDFVLRTYPGSENPASFESLVRLYDDERGIDGMEYRIYMNHPLTYRGFKHFQSSYDRDRRGTILSVNHDPGKWPTYIGYFFVGLGFLITLTRGLVWNRNPGR